MILPALRRRWLVAVFAVSMLSTWTIAEAPEGTTEDPPALLPHADARAILEDLAGGDSASAARARRALEVQTLANAGNETWGMALLDAVSALVPSNSPQSSPTLEDAGIGAWLDVFVRAAAVWQEVRSDNVRLSHARREGVRWAGYACTGGCVAPLQALVDDPEVWREAMTALVGLPGDIGAQALVDRLSHETSSDRMLEIVRLLAYSSLAIAELPLRSIARGEVEPGIAMTAIESLARLGVAPTDVFKRTPQMPSEYNNRYAAAGLRAAQVLAEGRDLRRASTIFRQFTDLSGMRYQVRAALLGLASVESADLQRVALGYISTPGVRQTVIEVLAQDQTQGAEERLRQAYAVGDPSMKAGLIEIFARRGSPASRAAIEQALGDPMPSLRVAAARALGQVPSEADLFETATEGTPWARDEALRTFLDIAHSRSLTGDTQGAANMFRQLIQRRASIEAEREAIEGLGQTGSYVDTQLVAPFLEDPDLTAAAYAAFARLTARKDDSKRAAEELRKIAEISPQLEGVSVAVQELARLGEHVEPFVQRMGYLTAWSVLGPFPNENGSAFNTSFFTESRGDALDFVIYGGQRYRWLRANTEGLPAVLDFGKILEVSENRAAYAIAKFGLEKPMAGELWVGASGPFELWLNGLRIASAPQSRTYLVDDERISASFQEGVNRILIKVLHGTGPWQCSVRVMDRRNRPLDLDSARAPIDGSENVGVRSGSAASSVLENTP